MWLSATISLGVPVHPAGKDSVDPPNPAALHVGPVAPLNHSVTTTSSKYWTLSQDSPNAIMGKCAIINDGRCITSDPSATYEMLFDDQLCVFTAHKQLKITATHFDMSPGYDFAIVAGEQFPPSRGPRSAGPTGVGARAVPRTRPCQQCHGQDPASIAPSCIGSEAAALAALANGISRCVAHASFRCVLRMAPSAHAPLPTRRVRCARAQC